MRRRGATSSFGGLLVLFSLLFPLILPAQAAPVLEPSRQLASSSPQIPDSCKAMEKASDSAAAQLQIDSSQPSAETYDKLGTFFGRAGNYGCAIAAFEAALAFDPKTPQARYHLALALMENHEPKRAADELKTVIRQDPNSFTAHNALGLALQDLGEAEKAANEFETALRLNPRFALAFYDLAQLRSSQKKLQAAIHYLKEGLANSPASELALEMKLALAVAYAQQANYANSIPLFQEVLVSRPSAPELHFDLATAYAHLSDYAHAVVEYKEALRLDPSHNQAELSLAKALMNLSAVEDALPYLHDYVRRNPADSEGMEALGEALKDSVHVGEALEVLQRAVRMDPTSYKAHYELGVVLNRSGRDDEAIRELEAAIKLKPDGTEARYQLGLLLTKKKNIPAAREQFEAFEQLKHDAEKESQAELFNDQGNEFLKQGHVKEAVEAYGKALVLKPKDARLHFNLAVALSNLKDYPGEERELKKSIELDPSFAQAHNQLGSAFVRRGQFAEAEREFKAAIDNHPQYSEALNNLGTLFGRQGNNAEAEALFREAITDDPQYAQAFLNLGLTMAAEGNFSEAERHLQSALSINPNNTNALTALGMLQGKTGRDPESVKTFQKLVGLYPKSADAHMNLGIALGDVYDLKGALEEFSLATRLAPDSPMAHFNEGRVLYALGRMDEAKQELGSAVRLSPNYTDALFLLGVLEHSSPYATELFRRVVSLQPKNSQARFYLGRNLLQEGKRDEAIAQWKLAVESDPDNLSALSNLARMLTQLRSPEAGEYMVRLDALQQRQQLTDRVKQLNNFALQSASDNNWPQALAQLEEAIELCGNCAQLGILRKNIGLLYARKGDHENAKLQLELALKLLPDGPDAVAVAETLRRLSSRPSTLAPTR